MRQAVRKPIGGDAENHLFAHEQIVTRAPIRGGVAQPCAEIVDGGEVDNSSFDDERITTRDPNKSPVEETDEEDDLYFDGQTILPCGPIKPVGEKRVEPKDPLFECEQTIARSLLSADAEELRYALVLSTRPTKTVLEHTRVQRMLIERLEKLEREHAATRASASVLGRRFDSVREAVQILGGILLAQIVVFLAMALISL